MRVHLSIHRLIDLLLLFRPDWSFCVRFCLTIRRRHLIESSRLSITNMPKKVLKMAGNWFWFLPIQFESITFVHRLSTIESKKKNKVANVKIKRKQRPKKKTKLARPDCVFCRSNQNVLENLNMQIVAAKLKKLALLFAFLRRSFTIELILKIQFHTKLIVNRYLSFASNFALSSILAVRQLFIQ